MKWVRKRIGAVPRWAAAAAALLGALACGAEPPAQAADWALSAQRAATYERTCKSCHEKDGTGAPLAREPGAWRERLQKGPAVLLDSTIYGFRGMPPLGSCMECDEQDLRVFVAFMAGIERPAVDSAGEVGSR